jgi:hypothetical protein
MGFMRKALFLGTGGVSGLGVRANSKKERTAKAAEKQVRLQKQMLSGGKRTAVRSRRGRAKTHAAPKYDITCPKCATVQSSPAGRHFCPMCGFPMEVAPTATSETSE